MNHLYILYIQESIFKQEIAIKMLSIQMQVRSLGQEDPLEQQMATHYSIPAWKIPWTEEPGGL